jgi:hypothetical protein
VEAAHFVNSNLLILSTRVGMFQFLQDRATPSQSETLNPAREQVRSGKAIVLGATPKAALPSSQHAKGKKELPPLFRFNYVVVAGDPTSNPPMMASLIFDSTEEAREAAEAALKEDRGGLEGLANNDALDFLQRQMLQNILRRGGAQLAVENRVRITVADPGQSFWPPLLTACANLMVKAIVKPRR